MSSRIYLLQRRSVADAVLRRLYGFECIVGRYPTKGIARPPCIIEERNLMEDWNDAVRDAKQVPESQLTYSKYVIEQIDRVLLQEKAAVIELRNSSGNDSTLIHLFTIFEIQGSYYRLEAYASNYTEYSTQLTFWPTFRNDLFALLDMTGPVRLTYWNKLFSSFEGYDNFDIDKIDVTLHVYIK